MPDRDEYRRKQEECVEQSEKARTSAAKAKWLHIGEEWAKLADEPGPAAGDVDGAEGSRVASK
jgi:hypothetical protein